MILASSFTTTSLATLFMDDVDQLTTFDPCPLCLMTQQIQLFLGWNTASVYTISREFSAKVKQFLVREDFQSPQSHMRSLACPKHIMKWCQPHLPYSWCHQVAVNNGQISLEINSTFWRPQLLCTLRRFEEVVFQSRSFAFPFISDAQQPACCLTTAVLRPFHTEVDAPSSSGYQAPQPHELPLRLMPCLVTGSPLTHLIRSKIVRKRSSSLISLCCYREYSFFSTSK